MKKNEKTTDLVIEGLVDFLSETGQKDLLPQVADKLDDLTGRAKKVAEMVVASSVPLEKTLLNKIQKLVSTTVNEDLPVTTVVDKQLLGGFTVRVGDWFLDASVSKELSAIGDLLLS